MAREIHPLVVTFCNLKYRFMLFISNIRAVPCGPDGPCTICNLQNSTDSRKNLEF